MFRSLSLAFTASLFAAHAQAATFTQAVSFGPSLTDFTTETLIVFPFDTTLGTLTAVNLNLAGSATLNGSVKNDSPTTQSFQISTTTTIALNSNSGTNIGGLSLTLTAGQSFNDLASDATVVFGPYLPSATKDVEGTPLSAFVAGPISFTASTSSLGTILGSGNNLEVVLSSTASGVLTVTYVYDDLNGGEQPATVPEPASLALLGVGLLGARVLRSKRT